MRFEITFKGRVQGVGFRVAAHDIAHHHKVVGWVRNEADGSVAMVLEGDEPEIERYLDELRERLGQFITEERIEKKAEGRGDYQGFEVR